MADIDEQATISTCSKRRRGDTCDVNTSPTAQLSVDEVNIILEQTNDDRNALLKFLSNEKDTSGKKKLRDFINSFSDALNKISCAYLCRLESDSVSNACNNSLLRVCERIENVSASLSQVSQSFASSCQHSYASIASGTAVPSSRHSSTNKVSLNRGKPFDVKSVKRVVIGPLDRSKANFPSSKATRDALFKAINPVDLKVNFQRVSFGPKCSVFLEGDSLEAAPFHRHPALANAGLEVKPDIKLNPRIIVHDIPVELTNDDIINSIIEQNLTDFSRDDIKIIYLYPARDKKTRSCVVEVSPSARSCLFKNKKLNIGWISCRFEDHIYITQCYNCMQLGHLAVNCKNTVCCGNCSGEHPTKDCNSKANLCCSNCVRFNHTSAAHSASDKGKCPFLRKKIERFISLIDYGST